MVHFYGIYGVGAVIILETAQYFNKNNFTLFFGGYVMGSIIEYLISFFVEVLLNTKWWDYSNNILNINGRVCLLYSVFWGILSIVLVKKFNPIIDNFLGKLSMKFSRKLLKAIVSFVIVFLFFDCMATCYAQDVFVTRMAITNDIELSDMQRRLHRYNRLQEKPSFVRFVDSFWDDEKMIRTFPNMKVEDADGNVIYLDSLLPHIQPYYKMIFEK